ncbi:MAG: DNA polymerase IV [Bacillota bacterium]|nr:DNA polymerase IV [Bacillota bacterium]
MKHDIILCDLDAFFASVEQFDRPELRGKTVIVGGSPDARGVVSTCSYEARKYGIRSAMPVKKALALCPEAVLLPVNMERYKKLSEKVLKIFERFTPDIEPISIDEAYLALKKGTGCETAVKIRSTVREELGLPISIGISINKLLAKIACELAKPDNLKTLWPEDVPNTMWPLPVKLIPGVGPVTEKKLNLYGIKTVGDLARFPADGLVNIFGKNGIVLKHYANGHDDRELELVHKVRSISEETTFPQDVFDRKFALATLFDLSAEVGYRLRCKSLRARTISLKLRFADFKTITRDITLNEPFDTESAIYNTVKDLFTRYGDNPPWRLVGVRVSGLENWQQLSILPPGDSGEKEKKLILIRDRLRKKYGFEILYSARKLMKKQ